MTAWLLTASTAVAGADGAIEDQPLDELLDLMDDEMDRSASVADRVARSQREAPALVTVLTGTELEQLGARDLADALRLLPGYEFGIDSWNADLLLTRGVLADGRVLLLVDDHEWNELSFGGTSLANRIPVAIIDRIEVIRGPGSAVYGGHAMLGVVRVLTRGGTLDGVRVDAEHSWLPSGAYGRRSVAVSGGGPLGDEGRVGVSAVVGQGRRSDDVYADLKGHRFDQTDASAVDPALISASLRYHHLDAAFAAESYRTTWRDGGARAVPLVHRNDTSGVYGRAALSTDLGERTTATARVSGRYQEPWTSTTHAVPGSFAYYEARDRQAELGGSLVSQVSDRLLVQAGADVGTVAAAIEDIDTPERVRYSVADAWVDGNVASSVVDVTGGVRVDTASAYGSALSPRLVAVHAWRRFHYKVGVNQAFRSPGVSQSGAGVGPEKVGNYDAELGVGPTAWSYLTVSAFDSVLRDGLVYFYEFDPATGEEHEGYRNGDPFRTGGVEATADVMLGAWRASVGWSTIRALEPLPQANRTPDPSRALAVPGDKGVARLVWAPGQRVSLGAVTTWVGPRWAITGVDARVPAYTELPPVVVLDLAGEVHHVWVRGLTLGASVHDLLDANPPMPQPYDGLHAPTPGTGREILVRVTVQR